MTILLVIIFLFIEWKGREGQYAISSYGLKWKRPYRITFYYVIVFIIMLFGNFQGNEFIYFQF